MADIRLPSLPRARRRASEWLATLVVWSIAGVVAGLFLWLLASVLWNGVGGLSWHFLSEPVRDAGRAGGIAPILVSTSAILLVCLAVCLPLGWATAVLLAEFSATRHGLSRVVRRSLDGLAGVPSIVFGLFGNAFFCIFLGMGFSILSGGLTLACMALPVVIRATEIGLRSVPHELRLAAAALGLSRRATLLRLLLPAASPAIVVGVVLGVGRALAETAALIFTSGYVDRMPESFWDSGRALSVHIYDLSMNVAGGDPNAYTSALVLISLLLGINSLASWMIERWFHWRVLIP